MIDTHCHLYAEEFNADIENVMGRALQEGVTRFYLPAIDSTTNAAMLQLEQNFTGKCFAMMGLHPCSVKANYKEELEMVKELLGKRKFAGIGETGLDLHWDKSFIKPQVYALEYQADLALKYELPLILHTRDAMRETIDVIKNFSPRGLKGIFHCFGGSMEEAEEIIDMGFYLGIGGIITYKNSRLAPILSSVGLHNLVLETDAPYLSPVPFRGKRNEPGYLSFVAKKLAEITNTSVEEVTSITTRNAEQIFT
ncbi:MAG TPA: TatD family hydrolase [Ferruginibacter sp.]|nr:TatD family hydrolase [Ferruginibacter sp.]